METVYRDYTERQQRVELLFWDQPEVQARGLQKLGPKSLREPTGHTRSGSSLQVTVWTTTKSFKSDPVTTAGSYPEEERQRESGLLCYGADVGISQGGHRDVKHSQNTQKTFPALQQSLYNGKRGICHSKDLQKGKSTQHTAEYRIFRNP